MKTLWFLFTFLMSTVTLCSCTHTLYTHQQVLQKCRTKDDVLKQFGQPDEVNPGPGFDQWTYNMEKQQSPKKSQKDEATIAVPDSLVRDSLQRVNPDKFTKYVKFIFDKQGNVTGYKAEGIDLTHKEKDSFGKSFVTITGGIVIISALVALELYNNGAFDN
jgi:hypothetical protein